MTDGNDIKFTGFNTGSGGGGYITKSQLSDAEKRVIERLERQALIVGRVLMVLSALIVSVLLLVIFT